MTAVPFDTLKYMEILKDSGIELAQAEAITKDTSDAFSQMAEAQERNLATREDLKSLQIHLQDFILKAVGINIAILGIIQTVFHFMK